MTSEIKARNEGIMESKEKKLNVINLRHYVFFIEIGVCSVCVDCIDGRANETVRQPYSSHSAVKDVGEGKCEHEQKKYSQAIGTTILICSKRHAFVSVHTHYARMDVLEHTHRDTPTHSHTQPLRNHFA
jgi:hypothetical protein